MAICLLAVLFSCQNNGENKDISDFSRSINDSVSVTGLTADSVKLVKTAATDIKVRDVEQSVRAVSALAQKSGGMLTLQHLEAVEQGRKELKLSADSLLVITAVAPRANLTARVPSGNLEAFLFGVADLGYFTGSSHLQVDDKSLLYLENALKQKNRANVLMQPAGNRKSTAATLQAIAVKDEAIEQNMANRNIDAEVNYSTVNLTLFQNPVVRKETIANTNIGEYQPAFTQRLGNALADGWQYFQLFVIAFAHLWMFILSGFIVYAGYKYRMQKRKLKLS